MLLQPICAWFAGKKDIYQITLPFFPHKKGVDRISRFACILDILPMKLLSQENFFFCQQVFLSVKENFVSVVCNYRVSYFFITFLFYLWVGFPRMMTANLKAKKKVQVNFLWCRFFFNLAWPDWYLYTSKRLTHQ